METKQTAVEWLEDSFRMNFNKIFVDTDFGLISHLIEQAKAMEKEQISNGYFQGLIDGMNNSPKEYYKETYGK